MKILGIIGPMELVFILAAFFVLMLVIALVDILKNEFTESNKIVWLLVVILLPVIGPILYLFVGTGQKIKTPVN
jgi:hypothetical protein